VGSRFKINLAYIAGFLDGDGSLMLQIKKRKDGRFHYRFMATICFYQDTRHESPLLWIRDVFNIGYISRRKDGMSELRINGYKRVGIILNELFPYFRFKKIQSQALLNACRILSSKKFSKLSKKEIETLVNLVIIIQNENYITKKKKTKKELLKILGLTP